jgi:hypothetical protein
MVETAGTSFAAPLVVHGLSGLAAALGPHRSTANTLRVFTAHFAAPNRRHSFRTLGYGRLRETYSGAWECSENEVTVLYQDILSRAELVAFYFPVPDGLDPLLDVELLWTVAYTSAVDPTDAAEYTRSGLEIIFRPHHRRRAFKDAVTNEPLGAFDTERDVSQLQELGSKRGVVPSETPVAESQWRRAPRDEGALRQAGKWETLVQGRRTMSVEQLFRPRLDLNYLHRKAGVLVAQVPPLPVALLVTIRTPRGVPLYDLARRQYQVLTPLAQHVPIPLPAV